MDPYRAQTFYEAVGEAVSEGLAPNTVILCRPQKPYVCIGYFQAVSRAVDLDYCARKGLPVIRRIQGGGACYLDHNQLFYQVIARKDSPEIPRKLDELFRKFLFATVHAYRKLGVDAEYKPVNDVVARGRKISGNGVGEVGDTVILVGNIIMDLDYDEMVRVLKVPDEKFRDKLAKSMRDWLTSLKEELGCVPPIGEIKEALLEGYERIGLDLEPGAILPEEEEIYRKAVLPKHKSRSWLFMHEEEHPQLFGKVKVMGGVYVAEVVKKKRKLLRVVAEIAHRRIRDISIEGDFFLEPRDALRKLENALKGRELSEGELKGVIRECLKETEVLGFQAEDLLEALLELKSVGHG